MTREKDTGLYDESDTNKKMEEEKNWGYYVIESTITCTRELL